ncbi:thyroid hormone receptor-associated protein 3 isoform X3 [Toxotes jaculatrix]|uniref:thyroid hormone receptor-associated protein 3 isoform X3 n=1 Tax=Toxotes jaculatrix TaxID=941984 RepID=UPI001B3A893A|nr:thyroid hormone receptor-associated protein 3 isoform X3 [Toxotes jaculatrix]
MKKRTSSRSRSRSRSHSPSYNRPKKYPRGHQNNREFRGYHRGFRRPYNFRGRGRGYFPRGRYQRGGGGGGGYNNNNFRPNWKNYKQYPQKQQQQQQQQNHSRGRLHSPQKCSGSPPHGHSQHSDRSSSPLSRHSQHSSSSSHSSSPKCRPALLLANQNSKDVKDEQSASKEVQKGGGGDGEPVELVRESAGDAKEGADCGRTEGKWQGLTDCSSSPKRTSPLANSAVIVGQSSQTTNQSRPSPKNTNEISNGTPSWQMGCSSSSAKKSSHERLNPMLSSFDFFSNEEYLDGDKTAISIAFRKFLEEQNKKTTSAWENGKNTEANDVDMEQGKVNGKASAVNADSVSRKYKDDIDGEVSLNSFLKASPFLSADGEEEEEMIIKPHSKSLHKDWHSGDESSKPKSKVTQSARELFEECFGKWQNAAYSQVANSDLDVMAEEIYLSRKQDKAAAIAAALAKRELAGKFEELSPNMSCKARKMAKSPTIPPPAPPPRRSSDREMFMVTGEDLPLMSSRKQEAKFNVRMDFLGDSLISHSDILSEERQLSQDLVQSSKKDQEFRSIFQHVQAAQLHRSPSELFAQHIVTIVHHIKAQHFPSSGMTLNERFTMYHRRAAEKEMMKPRKSPEIHRRIDVSTSAFKKHSQLFEAMKSSEDGTYKDGGDKLKGDPMDLRLDIERRKKYSTHERDYNQDRGRDMGDSPDSSRERSVEKGSKRHKKSKKSKNKRSRSSSSSSSSSLKSQQEEDLSQDKSDPKDESFNRGRLGQRESPGHEGGRTRGGFQVRIRGRGWNRGNCQGNSTHSNPTNMAGHPKSEDWDPEYTPKSKQYYLHDDREREAECKWMDNRGRGRGSFSRGRARFIIRKATGGSNTNSPRWAHDKFQVNGEQGGTQEEETEQDHKQGETDGQNT